MSVPAVDHIFSEGHWQTQSELNSLSPTENGAEPQLERLHSQLVCCGEMPGTVNSTPLQREQPKSGSIVQFTPLSRMLALFLRFCATFGSGLLWCHCHANICLGCLQGLWHAFLNCFIEVCIPAAQA